MTCLPVNALKSTSPILTRRRVKMYYPRAIDHAHCHEKHDICHKEKHQQCIIAHFMSFSYPFL